MQSKYFPKRSPIKAINTIGIRLTRAHENALNKHTLITGLPRNRLVAIAVGEMLDRIAADLANQAQSTLSSLDRACSLLEPETMQSTTHSLQRRYGRLQRAEIRAVYKKQQMHS